MLTGSPSNLGSGFIMFIRGFCLPTVPLLSLSPYVLIVHLEHGLVADHRLCHPDDSVGLLGLTGAPSFEIIHLEFPLSIVRSS